MDILIDLMDGLTTFADMLIGFIAPHFLEIIIGLIMATFILGFTQIHR